MKLICKICNDEITTFFKGRNLNQPLCLMCLIKSCGGIWDKNATPDPEFLALNPVMSNTKGKWIARDGMTMKQVMEKVFRSLMFKNKV